MNEQEAKIQHSLGILEANVQTIMSVQAEIKTDMETRLRSLEADRNRFYGVAALLGAASGFLADFFFKHRP